MLGERLASLGRAGEQLRGEPVDRTAVELGDVGDALPLAPGQEHRVQGVGVLVLELRGDEPARLAAAQVVVDELTDARGRGALDDADGHGEIPHRTCRAVHQNVQRLTRKTQLQHRPSG